MSSMTASCALDASGLFGREDEGLDEAARDNAFATVFVHAFKDPAWRKAFGIDPNDTVSFTPPTPDDYAASFRGEH